jgi:hypothetical protein
MRDITAVLVSLVLMAGCASETELSENLTSQPAPDQWTTPSTLRFRAFDSDRKPLGTFTLELTNEPARTCVSGGGWRRAKPIDSNLSVMPLDVWWRDQNLSPSYQISGRHLSVLLNGGNICDAYPEVSAELTATGARGYLGEGGIYGGRKYGEVVVERLQ